MSLSQANVDALFNGALGTDAPAAQDAGAVSVAHPDSSAGVVAAAGRAKTTVARPTPGGVSVAARSVKPAADLRRILGLSVPVTAILAERDMAIEAILAISVGTIIEFDVLFDSDLKLQVADRTIGVGQGVKIGENFGLRVSRIGSVRDRIDAMGGR